MTTWQHVFGKCLKCVRSRIICHVSAPFFVDNKHQQTSNYIAFLFLCNAYFVYPFFLPLEHPTLDFDWNAVCQQLVDQTYFTL